MPLPDFLVLFISGSSMRILNSFDKAILEFNQVVLMLPDDPRKLTYEETEMLSRAYYNLSIAHLKLGRTDFADNYVLKAYQLSPTEENWNLLNDLKSNQK